jgi:dienelactone hydrolase
VKARILVCHGDADPFVPPEQLAKFEKEMKDAARRCQSRQVSRRQARLHQPRRRQSWPGRRRVQQGGRREVLERDAAVFQGAFRGPPGGGEPK